MTVVADNGWRCQACDPMAGLKEASYRRCFSCFVKGAQNSSHIFLSIYGVVTKAEKLDRGAHRDRLANS